MKCAAPTIRHHQGGRSRSTRWSSKASTTRRSTIWWSGVGIMPLISLHRGSAHGRHRSWTLKPTDYRAGGPARYLDCIETGQRIGFITPLTHNFCESCNRVRVTCAGMLYMCLGQSDSADLRAPLRASEGDQLLEQAILEAISRKPKGHDFIIDRTAVRGVSARHMSVTGG